MNAINEDDVQGTAPKIRRVGVWIPVEAMALLSRTVSESSGDDAEEMGTSRERGAIGDDDCSSDAGSLDSLKGLLPDDDADAAVAITADDVPADASGEEAREILAENRRLAKLTIDGESMDWSAGSSTLAWFDGLCRGLSHN